MSKYSMTPQLHQTTQNETAALQLLRFCPHSLECRQISSQEKHVLCEFRKSLEHCCRKNIYVSRSNSPKVTSHERCILNALAAAQSGDIGQVHTFLQWIAPRMSMPQLSQYVFQISAILARLNIQLEQMLPKPPVRRECAGLYPVIG